MPGPGTWVAGDILTAADLNAIGVWTDYTPTLKQNGTRTATVNYAKYMQINKFCFVTVDLSVTQTGSAANDISVTLPFNSSGYAGGGQTVIGTGLFYDSSATDVMLTTAIVSSGEALFVVDASTAVANKLGSSPSVALGSGDVLSFSVGYRTV